MELSLSEPLELTLDISAGSKAAKALDSASGFLQIFVHPRELYKSRSDFYLKQSTVEIAYVLHGDAGAHLLMGMHFDFQFDAHGDPKPGHPLFHVQLTDNLTVLSERLVKAKVDLTHMGKLPIMRVPTAHMSFTAALISLAADNFLDSDFKDFIGDVRGRAEFPHMSNDLFRGRMQQHDWRMRSCVWYPST